MPEFVFPAIDEWQDWVRVTLKTLDWSKEEWPALLSRTTYNDVRTMVADPLELPSHRDYYREERAALVCANFMGAPRNLWAGGVAFLWGMAASQYTITRLTGLQIADALWDLRGELDLDDRATKALSFLYEVVKKIKGHLTETKDISAAENLAKNCAKVVRTWLQEQANEGAGSLSGWLSKTA